MKGIVVDVKKGTIEEKEDTSEVEIIIAEEPIGVDLQDLVKLIEYAKTMRWIR